MESASVVKLIDEAGKISGNVLEGFVCHQIHGFNLQCLHEAFSLGIIIGIAAPAHGTYEAVLAQNRAIVFGGNRRQHREPPSTLEPLGMLPPPSARRSAARPEPASSCPHPP